jgi:hypothetical protein
MSVDLLICAPTMSELIVYKLYNKDSAISTRLHREKKPLFSDSIVRAAAKWGKDRAIGD